MTQHAIQSIATLLTTYSPRFADPRTNYAPVKQWIESGADLDRDILPVIRCWISKKPDIYSLGFFSRYITQAVEQNKKPAPVSDAERAKNIAYRTRRLGQRIPHEERWLAAWEEKNGKVPNSC